MKNQKTCLLAVLQIDIRPGLSTRVLYFKQGYTASTWDFEPLETFWNPLEGSAWNWDCCINHYEDYDWAELGYWNYTKQIEAHEVLGWTKEIYGTTNATLWPKSEFLLWRNLTEYQQYMAASKFCYTEEIWDERLPLYE